MQATLAYIQSKAQKAGFTIQSSSIDYGQLTITVEKEELLALIRFLKEDPNLLFKFLIHLTAVDYPNLLPHRFQVVYHFLSLRHNQRIRVKVPAKENDPVPSLTSVFAGADWYEREVFDMFGIVFAYHPDLRRILSDYGFSGHPMRKDFPLTGFVEVRYDQEKQRVAYDKVHLNQEYRKFEFESPWEAMKDAASHLPPLVEEEKKTSS